VRVVAELPIEGRHPGEGGAAGQGGRPQGQDPPQQRVDRPTLCESVAGHDALQGRMSASITSCLLGSVAGRAYRNPYPAVLPRSTFLSSAGDRGASARRTSTFSFKGPRAF